MGYAGSFNFATNSVLFVISPAQAGLLDFLLLDPLAELHELDNVTNWGGLFDLLAKLHELFNVICWCSFQFYSKMVLDVFQ